MISEPPVPPDADDDIAALLAESRALSGGSQFFVDSDVLNTSVEMGIPSSPARGIEFSSLRSKKSATSEIVWMDLNSCEELRRVGW
jgi:hypothetical protein